MKKLAFTCMHLADASISSDLRYIEAIYFISSCIPLKLNT